MAVKPKKDLKKLLKTVEQRKIPKQNPDQKLSLCMIVKNESQHLERCLESVQGVVDEIIVVDTGSKDDTIETAKKFDAKVYHFDWIDDFSAARNESIKHATGDWILVMDADEELTSESKDKLRSFLVDIGQSILYQVQIKNLGQDNKVAFSNYMVRLFKNSPSSRYVGRIHECIFSPSGFINISGDDVSLIHHGYKPGSETKIKGRNIPILESIINDESSTDAQKSFINFYLGISQMDVGKQEDAVSYFQQSISQLSDLDDKPLFSIYPYLKLMSLFYSFNREEELKELLAEAEADNKGILSAYEFWFYKGVLEISDNNYEKAIQFLEKAIEVFNDKTIEYFRLTISTFLYHFVFNSLAYCYYKLGNKAKVEKILDEAIEFAKKEDFDFPGYFLVLSKLYSDIDKYDKAIEICINLLETVPEVSKKEVSTFLSNIYMKTNQFDKAVKLQASIHDPVIVKPNWYKITEELENEKYFPAAESVYSVIIEVLPEEVNAYLGRAVARLIQNKTIEALKDLALAKKLAKTTEEITKLGLLYQQIGQIVQARLCFEDILKNSPEDYNTNLYLGSIDQSEGKISSAMERLNRLINLYPEDSRAYIQLGNLLLSNQKIDEAMEIFEKAKVIDSSNGYIYYTLGLCYLETNDKDTALACIEKALEIEPENDGLINLRKMVLTQ